MTPKWQSVHGTGTTSDPFTKGLRKRAEDAHNRVWQGKLPLLGRKVSLPCHHCFVYPMDKVEVRLTNLEYN